MKQFFFKFLNYFNEPLLTMDIIKEVRIEFDRLYKSLCDDQEVYNLAATVIFRKHGFAILQPTDWYPVVLNSLRYPSELVSEVVGLCVSSIAYPKINQRIICNMDKTIEAFESGLWSI